MKVAVSACLVGKNTKYNGKNNYNEAVMKYLLDKEYVTICPEVIGGLPTPRVPSERKDNKVINKMGEDVTINFFDGTQKEIEKLLKENINIIIVKEKSPSCGYKQIYDGTFTNTLTEGNGVFIDLALQNGFIILDDQNIQKVS